MTLLVGALALFTMQGSATAQVPTEDQEEQMDARFGYSDFIRTADAQRPNA
jgi:hypothetical protein